MKTADIIDKVKDEPVGSVTLAGDVLEADPQAVQADILAAFTDGSRLLTSRATESYLTLAWTSE